MATKDMKEAKGLATTEDSRALSHFDAMERRFSEMERTFEEFFRRPFSLLGQTRWPSLRLPEAGELSPSMDVYEEGGDVVVKVELPGMKKDEISVDFSDGTVLISGEKKHEEKVERKNYHMIERSYGSFKRIARMPIEVQTARAKATFRDGILEIRVPKTEEAKKKERKIPVE